MRDLTVLLGVVIPMLDQVTGDTDVGIHATEREATPGLRQAQSGTSGLLELDLDFLLGFVRLVAALGFQLLQSAFDSGFGLLPVLTEL